MKFDLVIPTYKRPEKLRRLLNSIDKNCLKFLNIYVYCDNNDTKTAIKLIYSFPNVKFCIMNKQYRAFGIWNYHLNNNFHTDAMIYVCDDIEFLPNTLMGLYLLWKQIGEGKDNDIVIGFNQVNLKSGSKFAMGVIGDRFAERYPYKQCFCPDYISFYADYELGYYAESIGKFYYGIELKIHHYHPSVYKNESDEAHKIVRDKNSIIDRQVNIARRRANLLWGKEWTLIRKEV